MASHVQVLGSGSADSRVPPCALLFFDSQRYLFGCGEGAQRACTEYHARMSKIRHVFITRIQHEMVGGLTGLLITLADLGLRRIGVHGPGSLRHFLQASRNVSVRSALTIDSYEISTAESNTVVDASRISGPHENHFEDQFVSVEVVVLGEHRVELPPLRPFPSQTQNHYSHICQSASATSSSSAPTLPAKPLARTSGQLHDSETSSSSSSAITSAIDPMAVDHGDDTVDTSIDDSSLYVDPPAKKLKHDHSTTPVTMAGASAPEHAACASSSVSSGTCQSTSSTAVASATVESSQAAPRPHEWIKSIQPSLVSYIVSLASTPGKFDLAKAKALGIPPGPLYAKLKAGESIQIRASELGAAKGQRRAPKGQQKKKSVSSTEAEVKVEEDTSELLTFHPADCVGAPIPGPKIAFIDCPNHAFLSTLVEHTAFKRFQTVSSPASSSSAASSSNSSSSPSISVIFHFTPLSLLTHPSYKAWMTSFGDSTQHILLHASTSIVKPVFKSAAVNYLKMQHYVNAEVFPAQIPKKAGTIAETDSKPIASEFPSQALSNDLPVDVPIARGVNLLRFHLLPPLHIRRESNSAASQGNLDYSQVLPDIHFPEDLEASLQETSNETMISHLKLWKQRMDAGKLAGRDVLSIAEEVKQEVSASESKDVSELEMEKEDFVAAAAVDSQFQLHAPTPIPSFTPSPTVLADLQRQPDSISPQFLFLGTGSAIPSKYRNVTGQFFHPGYDKELEHEVNGSSLPPHPVGGYFFDAGEGSYGQLLLRYAGLNEKYGPNASFEFVNNAIADLKCVWISHIHADHHLGFLSILSAYKQTWIRRYQAAVAPGSSSVNQIKLVSPVTFMRNSTNPAYIPKLLVVGPRRMYYWLKEYAAVAYQIGEEDDVTPKVDPASTTSSTNSNLSLFNWIEYVPCADLQSRQHHYSNFFLTNSPALASRYPLVHPRTLAVFQTVQVKHCTDAYGLVVETASSLNSESSPVALPPYKLVISGDTQPCQALIDAGVDATLLVHESTFEDDMIDEAADKRHSTTRQAIEVGLKMNASRILLTHFSQRYPKIPSYSAHFSARTCLAFDLMCVRFNQLAWLPSLTPAFAWMFDHTKLLEYLGGEK